MGQSATDLVRRFKEQRDLHHASHADALQLIARPRHGDLPAMVFADAEPLLIELVSKNTPDLEIVRAVNQAFLSIVRASYWDMIEHGDFYADEAEQMLSSITLALSRNYYDLDDFDCIEKFCAVDFADSGGRISYLKPSFVQPSAVHKLVHSTAFSATIAVAIIANTIITTIEQETRLGNDNSSGWLVVEIIFTLVFLVESVMKLIDEKLTYFQSAWNLFDFFLVVFGLVGCSFSIMVAGLNDRSEGNDVPSSEANLIRTAQVFRMMRLVRVFRLYRYWMKLQMLFSRKLVSLEVAEHMVKASVLNSFVRAHMHAQTKLVKFFGKGDQVDSVEVARCLLQSKLSVYKAMRLADYEEKKLGSSLTEDLKIALECRDFAECCVDFLLNAQRGGILTPHEAESMLHPLYNDIGKFVHHLRAVSHGDISELQENTDEVSVSASRSSGTSQAVCEAGKLGSEAGKSGTLVGEDKDPNYPSQGQPSGNSSKPEPVPVGRVSFLGKDEPAQEPSPEGAMEGEAVAASSAAISNPAGPSSKKKGAKGRKSKIIKSGDAENRTAMTEVTVIDVEEEAPGYKNDQEATKNVQTLEVPGAAAASEASPTHSSGLKAKKHHGSLKSVSKAAGAEESTASTIQGSPRDKNDDQKKDVAKSKKWEMKTEKKDTPEGEQDKERAKTGFWPARDASPVPEP